jgi:hypothetical protein
MSSSVPQNGVCHPLSNTHTPTYTIRGLGIIRGTCHRTKLIACTEKTQLMWPAFLSGRLQINNYDIERTDPFLCEISTSNLKIPTTLNFPDITPGPVWDYNRRRLREHSSVRMQHLKNRVLRATDNFERRKHYRDLHIAFKISYVYDYRGRSHLL